MFFIDGMINLMMNKPRLFYLPLLGLILGCKSPALQAPLFLTLRAGKVVYDLNGLASDDWNQ